MWEELQTDEPQCSLLWYSYTLVCLPVFGDIPGALASGLSHIQVDNHGISSITTYINVDLARLWIFLSYPQRNIGLFFLLTTGFYFKISFQKSLNRLRCKFT